MTAGTADKKKQNIHVAQSPLTNTIYAGGISKDRTTWLHNKTDVTTEALVAVALYVEQAGTQVIHKNGAPEFEISVRRFAKADAAGGKS